MLSPIPKLVHRRLSRGLGAQSFIQTIQLIIRLAEVPLFLNTWGAHLYGEWLMITAIPAYLFVIDLGFTSAASREMSMRSGAGDRNGALTVFQSTWAFLIIVSLAVALFAVSLYGFGLPAKWFGETAIQPHTLNIVLLLLIAIVLLTFQGALLNGGLWSAGRYPLAMVLTAAAQILEFAGICLALLSGGGPLAAAIGFLSGRLIGTVLIWYFFRRAAPWLQIGFWAVSLKELKKLKAAAFASLAIPIASAFNIQGVRLVVGLLFGPAMLAAFTPLRTLSRLALQPLVIASRTVEPELAIAFGGGDTDLFHRIFTDFCQLALWGTVITCLVLASVSHWLFPFWTDNTVTMDWPVYLLLLAGVIMHAFWHTAFMVPYATNRHSRIAAYYSLVYGFGAAAFSYVLANELGIVGIGLALATIECLMAIYVIPAALSYGVQQSAAWFFSVVRPPLSIFRRCQQ
jgi:O-antigen/teichoic acid export membrane protein